MIKDVWTLSDSVGKIGISLIGVSVVSVILSIASFFMAIWTYGPDSGRLAGTGFIFLLVAWLTAMAGAVVIAELSNWDE